MSALRPCLHSAAAHHRSQASPPQVTRQRRLIVWPHGSSRHVLRWQAKQLRCMCAARCHAPSLSPPIASQRPVGKKIETQSLRNLPEGSSSKQLRASCFDSWIRHSLNQSATCACRRSQHAVYQASQSCSWQRSNRRALETLMRGSTYHHQLKQRSARPGMQSAYARSAAASLPAAGAAQGMVVGFNPLHGQACNVRAASRL